MELSSDQALRLASEKRREILTTINADLTRIQEGREKQLELSSHEKGNLNLLAFGIIGAVVGISPQTLCNPFILFGLALLLIDAFIFGFCAEWRQRILNADNFEKAGTDLIATARPYFDSYDALIRIEPPNQELFDAQANAYIDFLEKYKEMNSLPRIAKGTAFGIGASYLTLYGVALLTLSGGLLFEYCFKAHL